MKTKQSAPFVGNVVSRQKEKSMTSTEKGTEHMVVILTEHITVRNADVGI